MHFALIGNRRNGNTNRLHYLSFDPDNQVRTFETMASGSFLMTDNIIHIDELFQDGKHCALYDDLDDMVEKIRYYLANPKERERIDKVGYEEVMKRHTFKSRIKLMLEKSKHLIKENLCQV